jgi:probable O-glycosylation ligase (exosortase A-associated)
MRDIILAIIFAVLIPLSFLRPFIGLLGWTWIGYMNPHRYTWSFMAWGFPVALVVAIPTLAGLAMQGKVRIPLRRETILLVALWVWFAVSTVHVYLSTALYHHWAFTLGTMIDVSKVLLMTFVAVILVKTRDHLRWWYLVTLFSFLAIAWKGAVWAIVTGGEERVMGPPRSMIADNNALALALNMCIPMIFCFLKIEKHKWMRRFLWASIPIIMIAIAFTYSRGGLVGLMMVMAIIIWRSRFRVLGAAALLLFGLLGVALAPEKWTARMDTMRTGEAEKDLSVTTRFDAWRFARMLANDYPITGAGFETFTRVLYSRYLGPEYYNFGPHSVYFQMMAEHGYPGLLIFLSIIGSCLLTCRRVKRWSVQNEEDGRLGHFADMVSASLMAFAASGAFLGFAYFDLFYQMIGTTIILATFVRQEQDADHTEAVMALSAHEPVPLGAPHLRQGRP